jgi:hypothetical protein
VLNTKDVIGTIGRDKGKVFRITEMPAAKAEKWATRALLCLNKSGVQIPPNINGLGMVGVAILGLNIWLAGSIKFEDLEPLMDEMFVCVHVVPDPTANMLHSRPVKDEDIEEWTTRAWLRSEVIELHTGFSPAEALLKLISEITTSASSIMSTSPQ